MKFEYNKKKTKLYKDIASTFFEFTNLIDLKTGICHILTHKERKIIPYLLFGKEYTYDEQLDYFLKNSVAKNDVNDAASKMSLKRIEKETKNGDTYAVTFSVLLPGGKIRFKKWRYSRLNGDDFKIIFTREDVTDVVLSEHDSVTKLYSNEQMIVESRLILEKN